MIDLDTVFETASLPERTVPVCLRGDLLGALLEAESRLQDEMEQAVTKAGIQAQLGRDVDSAEIRAGVAAEISATQDAVNAAQEAVKAVQLPFRLRALPEHEWTALCNEHEPRDGNDDDADAGINTATFPLELLRRSLIDPKPDDAQWTKLLATLHLSELRKLTAAADSLSRRTASLVPFSFGASAPTPASASKSGSPAS